MPDIKKIKIIHAQLGALANKRGFKIEKDEKEQLVQEFTKRREISTTKLKNAEADALIAHLQTLVDGSPESFNFKRGETMRRHIIAMAHEMHWELPDGKIDMARVNGWCVNYGYRKRVLNDYHYTELPELVTQFKKVYQSFLSSI